jgi:hypothetical protein
MNPRVTAIVAGLVITALGLAGLMYPDRVMGFLGFAMAPASKAAAVLGEIRATYGGLFTVMGIMTLWAGIDPVASRSRLLLVGLLWLGACAGRGFGAYVDGNPGVPGWVSLGFEFVVGAALVAASFSARPTAPRSVAAAPPSPPPPVQPAAASA